MSIDPLSVRSEQLLPKMSPAVLLPALMAILPKRTLAVVAVALVAGAPMSTVAEWDVRLLHGAVPATGFYGLAPGALYEHISGEDRAQGGYPVCNYVDAQTGAPPKEVVRDGRGRFENVIGAYVPYDAALDAVFGEQSRARSRLEMPLKLGERGAREHSMPSPLCEDAANRAAARGNVVCVVDSVILRDGAPWAVRFNEYAHMPAGATTATRCPFASPGNVLWSIKRPLIQAH
jgi:hypothetical protein